MRNIAIALGSICIVLAAGGCQTVEFDDPALLGSAEAEPGIETLKEEEQANIEALEDYAVEEELKTTPENRWCLRDKKRRQKACARH